MLEKIKTLLLSNEESQAMALELLSSLDDPTITIACLKAITMRHNGYIESFFGEANTGQHTKVALKLCLEFIDKYPELIPNIKHVYITNLRSNDVFPGLEKLSFTTWRQSNQNYLPNNLQNCTHLKRLTLDHCSSLPKNVFGYQIVVKPV